MVEETEENWRENVRKLIEMDPDCVSIYQMEVPYNTGIFKQMKAEGKLVAPVANWATKRAWTGYAFDELEKAGYTVTSGYTAVKNPEKTKFVYRDSLWKGADLIGAGVSAFSHIGGVHFQNITEIEQYIETVSAGSLPVLRAMATTPEERLIRELILQLKLGRVEAAYFENKFSTQLALVNSGRSLNAKVLAVGEAVCLNLPAKLSSRLIHCFTPFSCRNTKTPATHEWVACRTAGSLEAVSPHGRCAFYKVRAR
jgi:coproporphyrinogen III oxidase-like Fe-S oxidoreductase